MIANGRPARFVRPRHGAAGVLLVASLVSSASLGPAATPPEGPIVIFLVDTLRADRVSVYGAPRATTPAADALARESVVFERAYALSSWTRASVATLLTSRLPAGAGVFGRNGALDAKVPYLPELLREKGWKTAAFVGNGNIFDVRAGFQRGFDSFTSVTGPGGRAFPVAREVVEPALAFLRGQRSRRFFLYVHVVDPHADYFTESPWHEMFADARPGGRARPLSEDREGLLLAYDRAIRQADDQFARIAAVLKDKGWWRDATVVFTSDHGEEFGEHGGRAHGYTLFEEQVHVPLIVKYPDGWTTPRRRQDLVTLADVTPTLAEMCGVSRNDGWIGTSLREPRAAPAIYLTEDLDNARLYALRRGSEKLIVQLYPRLRTTLFDLGTDPGETSGRVLEGSELSGSTHALTASLERWRARDLKSQPGVHIERAAAGSVTIDLVANLSGNLRPFLTPRDILDLAPGVRAGRLELSRDLHENAPFELILAADDRGDPPPYRLNIPSAGTNPKEGAVRATTVKQPVLAGTASDDVLRNLRGLGYLAGPAR